MDHPGNIIYEQISPHASLAPYIDAFWTLTGANTTYIPDKILPDGCVDIILNCGPAFKADQENAVMNSGQAYLVGTMMRYKEMVRPPGTRLIGIRFKPGGFPFFYDASFLKDVSDKIVEFDQGLIPAMKEGTKDLPAQLNRFFTDRLLTPSQQILTIIAEIQQMKGRLTVSDLSRRNYIPVRQLERLFSLHSGISPKEFINFTRYQSTIERIRANQKFRADHRKSVLDIAVECGYYDHAHLSNEIKKYSGSAPSVL